jgi:hypothetical protein
VEILATMTLVAIVIPTALRGLSVCTDAAGHAADATQAAALAASKLEELAACQQLDQTLMEGDFGEDWPNFRWQAQLVNWQQDALGELTVTVSWQRRDRDHQVTLTTLVYDGTLAAAPAGEADE